MFIKKSKIQKRPRASESRILFSMHVLHLLLIRGGFLETFVLSRRYLKMTLVFMPTSLLKTLNLNILCSLSFPLALYEKQLRVESWQRTNSELEVIYSNKREVPNVVFIN